MPLEVNHERMADVGCGSPAAGSGRGAGSSSGTLALKLAVLGFDLVDDGLHKLLDLRLRPTWTSS